MAWKNQDYVMLNPQWRALAHTFLSTTAMLHAMLAPHLLPCCWSNMPNKNGRKNTAKSELPDEQSNGMWIDAALISRLHGRKSSPLAIAETHTSESSRLLHYADVMLGTDKREKFVSSKPTKERKDL